MDKHQMKLFDSQKTDDWETPKWLYHLLDACFKFDLDPCPLNYTADGLQLDWFGSVFVNPPYSQVYKWFEKAEKEINSGRVNTVVFLVFANTDTQWFHKFVYDNYDIVFIEGRLKFSDKKGSAVRPSMLCIWKKEAFNETV